RLMSFVWSLPIGFRSAGASGGAVQKKILKDIVSRSIPRDYIERPKKGFGVPIEKWVRGPMVDWAESLINPSVLKQQGLLDTDIVNSCWQNIKANPDAGAEFIWSILVLQQWLDSERPSF
ncbi:asparagine synthase C-terminal domain-containing protein, partial [bacterium]|nr:asparagine synthase C-terminal domain-containing protein [bacterium]